MLQKRYGYDLPVSLVGYYIFIYGPTVIPGYDFKITVLEVGTCLRICNY